MILPRQVIMSTIYCFYGIFSFFLPLVSLKQAGFFHFHFDFISIGQVEASFIPSA